MQHAIMTRRQVVATAIAASLIGARPGFAAEEGEALREALLAFTDGAPVEEGRVRLDLPEVAENGNTVPLTVAVESPMTREEHVVRLAVLAEANPHPLVGTFHFSPLSGRAEVATRIRLAESQVVTAIAEMSDGSFHIAARRVTVTVGGCVG